MIKINRYFVYSVIQLTNITEHTIEYSNIVAEVRASLESRNRVIKSLYNDENIKSRVIGTLIKKGCKEEMAKDFFSDAILNFIKACYKPEFEVRNVPNYIVGIAKFLFLNWVTKSSKEQLIDETKIVESQESPEIVLIREERKNPLQKLLSQLDETCRKVLLLWSHKKRMKEIAVEMNYKSEGMARKKKHQCLRKLYQIVNDNPALKDDLRSML